MEKRYHNMRVNRSTWQRLRVLAAAAGVSMIRLLDELVAKAFVAHEAKEDKKRGK